MLSIDKMLEIDPELSSMSREELEELRTAMYEVAQLGFDIYWTKKHGSKYPVGLLTDQDESGRV